MIFLGMVLYAPRLADDVRWKFLDAAFILFLISSITDILDGKIARKYNVTSKFGRMIDPLVDKVLVCGSFICFAIIAEPKLGLSPTPLAVIHWTVAGILILREVYVTVLRHWAEARGINFAATKSGKIKMFIQVFAVGTVVMKMAHVPDAVWGYWITALVLAAIIAATVTSGIMASRRGSLLDPAQKSQ